MNLIKSAIITIICLVAIAFGLRNNQSVSVNYYFHGESFDIPLYLILYISLIIGFILGWLWSLCGKMKCRKIIKKFNKELGQKEQELASLRNLPINESKVQVKNEESAGTLAKEV